MSEKTNNSKKTDNKSLGYALKTRKYMHIGIVPIALFLLKMTFRHPRSLRQNSWQVLIGIYVVVILGYLMFYGIVNLVIYLLRNKHL
ncbi:hypothetical protein [Apilactobacillus micheneri]|uniref:hypothetical protein n=1 Tax=Apilactobacillus micheneri TaxID=1899430 RepID=UPI00112854DE|nr:hypothetical protein [Apilactobacillus micheneri]TPR50755.1 hypothetical protein DY126_06820 [Apilactobacillus micheneri]